MYCSCLASKCLWIWKKIETISSMRGMMWSIQKPTPIGTFRLLIDMMNSIFTFIFHACRFYWLRRALFGYEGHTNILKVVSNGNGGLLELTDELNSGKILYAFVKITNDKINLTKYLIINWQVGVNRINLNFIQQNFSKQFLFGMNRVKVLQLYERELVQITYETFRRF